MPTPDNPHYERHSAFQLVFWRGNEASGRAGADRVEVRQLMFGVGSFKLPEQEADLHNLERALMRAHAAGKADKAHEIRKAIGL